MQIAWAVLSAAWNLGGVALLASGRRPPGPTASLAAAGGLLVVALLFRLTASRRPAVYALLSALSALMATAAVVNAFLQDPALWPSEAWRYAGVVLNGVGAVASALVLVRQVWRRA